MKRLVVDASVAAKWFFEEIYAEPARKFINGEVRLFAPDFFLLEMDSLFSKRVRRRELSPADGKKARGILGRLGIQYVPSIPLRNAAYEFAVEIGSAVYDALYLTLAASLAIPLVTADRKFFRQAQISSAKSLLLWVEEAF